MRGMFSTTWVPSRLIGCESPLWLWHGLTLPHPPQWKPMRIISPPRIFDAGQSFSFRIQLTTSHYNEPSCEYSSSKWEKPILHNLPSWILGVVWILSFRFWRVSLIKIDDGVFVLQPHGSRRCSGFMKMNLINLVSCHCHRRNASPIVRDILLFCLRREISPGWMLFNNGSDKSRFLCPRANLRNNICIIWRQRLFSRR